MKRDFSWSVDPRASEEVGKKIPGSERLRRMTPIELFAMSDLLEMIPADLSDSVCGFDIDGTLIEPSSHDFKTRVPVE